jgi:hypothetical protein
MATDELHQPVSLATRRLYRLRGIQYHYEL